MTTVHDELAEDLIALLSDDGEAVTYTPDGAAGQTINALFDFGAAAAEFLIGEANTQTARRATVTISCDSDDGLTVQPAAGDTITRADSSVWGVLDVAWYRESVGARLACEHLAAGRRVTDARLGRET